MININLKALLLEKKLNINTKRLFVNKEYFTDRLKNIGNNCYLNSCLQILFHIKQFQTFLLSLKTKKGLAY